MSAWAPTRDNSQCPTLQGYLRQSGHETRHFRYSAKAAWVDDVYTDAVFTPCDTEPVDGEDVWVYHLLLRCKDSRRAPVNGTDSLKIVATVAVHTSMGWCLALTHDLMVAHGYVPRESSFRESGSPYLVYDSREMARAQSAYLLRKNKQNRR